MSAENNMFGTNDGGARYISITQGKFAQRVDEDQAKDGTGNIKPGYRKRALEKGENAGKLVYEFVFDYLTGTITNVRTESGNYGVQLIITFQGATGEVVIFTTQLANQNNTLTSIAASIGDQIALVDLSKPVKMGLYKKDGSVRGVYFDQNGYIPNPNNNLTFKNHIANRPQPTESVNSFTGEKEWDWKQTSMWQYAEIKKVIDGFVQQGVGNVPSQAQPTHQEAVSQQPTPPQQTPVEQEEEIGYLPF